MSGDFINRVQTRSMTKKLQCSQASTSSSNRLLQPPKQTVTIEKFNKSTWHEKIEQEQIEQVPLFQFKTSVTVWSVCPVSNDTAWICGDLKNQIQLVNSKGTVLETQRLDVYAKKLCCHPTSLELFCSVRNDLSIRHINTQNGVTTVLFYTKADPWSIACTTDAKMVVGLGDYSVAVFTYSGEKVYTKQIEFCTAFHVSVCSQTRRIALACANMGVIVLDDTLQEICRYNGGYSTAAEGREDFKSWSVVFDGDLFVGDVNNTGVHILDGATLQYMKTIHISDIFEVRSLGKHGNMLWVGCREIDRILCFEYK